MRYTLARWSRSLFSAIATMLAGVVVGGVGFIHFVRQVASDNNDLMLEAARRQNEGTLGGHDVSTAWPVALTAIAPLAFVIGTPLGALSAYLVVTGVIRTIAGVVREPIGDPIVHGTIRWVRWQRGRETRRRDADVRVSLEGPEVADRLVTAQRMHVDDAELVVVASRRKTEWTEGTILDCGGLFYRVGPSVERMLPNGLRTLYPLREQPDAGVFRRLVSYDLPVLLLDPVER
ncbi:MAG TPA: hypothetical protein VFV19_12580 [Candidatus Polarisedimenticolaceae bacterium]|nr:hypothetical protein [Candidatus Polarisedimenticolaceae bacterium]